MPRGCGKVKLPEERKLARRRSACTEYEVDYLTLRVCAQVLASVYVLLWVSMCFQSLR